MAGHMLTKLVPDIKKTANSSRRFQRGLPRAGYRRQSGEPGHPSARLVIQQNAAPPTRCRRPPRRWRARRTSCNRASGSSGSAAWTRRRRRKAYRGADARPACKGQSPNKGRAAREKTRARPQRAARLRRRPAPRLRAQPRWPQPGICRVLTNRAIADLDCPDGPARRRSFETVANFARLSSPALTMGLAETSGHRKPYPGSNSKVCFFAIPARASLGRDAGTDARGRAPKSRSCRGAVES